VPNAAGDKAKGAILSRAVQYIHHLKENEARNIEKWTLEKLLMDQAMSDVQVRVWFSCSSIWLSLIYFFSNNLTKHECYCIASVRLERRWRRSSKRCVGFLHKFSTRSTVLLLPVFLKGFDNCFSYASPSALLWSPRCFLAFSSTIPLIRCSSLFDTWPIMLLRQISTCTVALATE